MKHTRWQTRFYTIWIGQSASLLGSTLVGFAIIWWMTETTLSAQTLATAHLVTLLPRIFLGPLIGTLVDRWSRRWTMAVADSAIAVGTGVLAYLFWIDSVQLWHVYLILFARALGEAFHSPAMQASTSLMVPKEHLTRVAGMNQTRMGINRIAGAPLGALMVSTMPIQGILAIDVLTAALAVLPLLFVDVPQPDPTPTPPQSPSGHWRSVLRDLAEGFRYLWRERALLTVIASLSLLGFLVVPVGRFAPLLIADHFHGGPAEYGLHSSMIGVSMIAGGVLMSIWGGFERRMTTILVGLACFGTFATIGGLAPSNAFWLYLAANLLRNTSNALIFGPLDAVVQSAVPPEMQGRVFSLKESLTFAMAPLGLAVIGPLADVTGVRPWFILSGVAVLVMALVWTLVPSVRNLDNTAIPTPQEAETT